LVGGEGFAVDASLIVADANKQRSTPGPRWNKKLDAEAVSRATKEYLATLDDAAFGAASDVTPKFVSPSDPAAQRCERSRYRGTAHCEPAKTPSDPGPCPQSRAHKTSDRQGSPSRHGARSERIANT
jgi:hypothetical protein